MRPFADDAPRYGRERLFGASRDQSDDSLLVRGVAGARTERLTQLLAQLTIGAERGPQVTINFADDARFRRCRDSCGKQMVHLPFDRADNLMHGCAVRRMEKRELRSAPRVSRLRESRLRGRWGGRLLG